MTATRTADPQAWPAVAMPGTRWLSAFRAAYGVALLCAPKAMITRLTGGPVTPRTCAVVRVLGVRQLAQAAVCGLVPARGLIEAGSAVDGLHAASMLALAGTTPSLRRAAATDGAIAATLAGLSAVALRR
jgi:hypothetical protein